ncbi:MAG: hypothetical protein ACLQVM_23895 [Terriglobia bacterium]
MNNAHERFGVLEYTKRMKDTTTRIRLRVDRFVGEVDTEGTCKGHLISVLGRDSDVGAIWAAVIEQNHFTVEAPGIDSITVGLGEGAQCFRGTINIAGRRPVRHLVAISTELAKTRPGTDPEGKRTVLCDSDPTFVLYRIAQRYGLPVVPEWATWFNEELTRHRMIQPIVGLGCSPVLVRGSKKVFLKWIGRALRQKKIVFPESDGPVHWSLGTNFFRTGEIGPEDESPEEPDSKDPAMPATQEGESCVSY